MADDEPTWGDSVAGTPAHGPKVNPIPNQRSMPVTGGGATPYAGPPHSDYRRQAAQHFGSPPVPPPSYPVSYPAIPPTNNPIGPPYSGVPAPPQVGAQPYPAYPQASVRDSFITRLMERGVQGGLFRQPWFQDLRQRNPDPFVYISFGVGVLVSIVLSLIPSSFVVTVLTTLLWAGIGYLYFALGTKLAHQFIEFGICLVGGLVMLARALSAIVTLSVSGSRYYGYGGYAEPVIVLMVVLLVNLAGVAALAYLGVQVHRGIQRMSQP